MSKRDPIAEQFSDWLDAPSEALARMAGPLAADVQIATQVRQTLKTMLPDTQFVTQLEARLLASSRAPSADQQPGRTGHVMTGWVNRLRDSIPVRLRSLTLAATGLATLLALILVAVILLTTLGRNKQSSSPTALTADGSVTGQDSYILSETLTLPDAPAQVPLFGQSTREWNSAEARRVAVQFGLREPLSLTLTGPKAYNVSDGTILLDVRGDLITYRDTSVSAQSVTYAPYNQSIANATTFLTSHGLLNFPYRTEPGDPGMDGQIRFVRLADGRPVQSESANYEALVNVAADGRIASVRYISRTLTSAGQVGIISAADAWQALQHNQIIASYLSGRKIEWTPTPIAPPVNFDGNANGIEGRLTAVIYEYPGAISPTQRIQATLSESRNGTGGGWNVDLDGQNLRELAKLDGLRVKVWGHYDAASNILDVKRYEQADPTEHSQAWLGVVTSTVMGDGVMRSFFTTQDGQRFLISDSLRCPPEQTICPANIPTDHVVIIEGTFGQETFDGVTVLYPYAVQGGGQDMTEQDLAQRRARPYIIPVATSAPQPTVIAPNTPPYIQGQRVAGLEGYLQAVVYQDEQGQTTRIQAGLSILPLNGNKWGINLRGTRLQGLAQYDGLRVRIWGIYTYDEKDQPVIDVLDFEKVDPMEKVQAWLGTLLTATLTNRTVALLQTREGERFVLASSLLAPEGAFPGSHEPPWGKQVIQEGVLRPETFGGYRIIQNGVQLAGVDIDRMTDLSNYQMQPHPWVSVDFRSKSAGIVERVELIYYTYVAPEHTPVSAAIHPVWRFTGHLSDSLLFTTLVEATPLDTARITLDTDSGQRNATWTLSSAEIADLKVLLAAAALTPAPAARATDGALAYRGMLIDLPDATTGAAQQWRVFNGVIAGQSASWADPQRRLERWLLRSGVGGFENALYAAISQQIDAGLPEVWTATLPLSDLSAEEPSPSWNDSDLFFLILVNGQPLALSRKDPNPNGCLIKWDAQRQRFVEPCLGSEYDRHGTWLSGPALQDMNRFPARVNGARVEVDFTRTVEGTFRGQRLPDGNYAPAVTATTPEPSPPVVVTKEIIAAYPTATPVGCAPSPDVSVSISPVNHSEIEIQVIGLQPNERVKFEFESSHANLSSILTEEPQVTADETGRFRWREEGLHSTEGSASTQWLVRVIHQRGVNCATIVLPERK